jgi:ribosomal-protein-alanine N-acetyltransferase
MALPAPVHHETARVVLTMPPPREAPAVVAYLARNRARLTPLEPERPAELYTEPFWQERLELNRREYAEDLSLRLVMYERQRPDHVVGMINFTAIVRGGFQACLLGYSLDEAAEGRGLMSEGLSQAIAHAFGEMQLHRVQANHLPENVRSARLLRRLGFVNEGFARNYLHIGGRWRDHVLTSLTRDPE